MKYAYLLFLIAFVDFFGYAQTTQPAGSENFEKSYIRNYQIRIKKSYINGVYIPKDVQEALDIIIESSDPKGLKKLTTVPEEVAANGLRKGLAKWIEVRWGFYEGSRLSHFIKTKYGISHPKDMSEFIVRALHRRMNGKALELEQIAAFEIKRRKDARIKRLSKMKGEVISKRVLPPEERPAKNTSSKPQ